MSALEQIAALKAQMSRCAQEITDIRKACQHDYKPSNPESLSSSSPRCALCGDEKFGWWCEESPSKECDYSRPSGRGFNPDDCRYCHHPEERK